MARYCLVLLVVLAGASCALGLDVSEAFDLVRLGRKVVVQTLESLDVMDAKRFSEKLPGEDAVFLKIMERELLQRMGQISQQIDEYQTRMEDKADAILTKLLLQLPMQGRLDDSLRDLDNYLGQVQGLYQLFELYANNSDKYETFTMLQFAKTCVSPRLGELPDVLKSIHRLMVSSGQQVYNRSVLVLLANQMAVGTWRVARDNGL